MDGDKVVDSVDNVEKVVVKKDTVTFEMCGDP